MLSIGLFLLECRANNEKIPVPQGILPGKAAYVGESVLELQETRGITENSSGGYFEEIHNGSLFNIVDYTVEEGEIVEIGFIKDYLSYSPIYYLDSLKNMCDRAYGAKSVLKTYRQDDGYLIAVREWSVGGDRKVCVSYPYERSADSTSVSITFEVGCQPEKWRGMKPVSDSEPYRR